MKQIKQPVLICFSLCALLSCSYSAVNPAEEPPDILPAPLSPDVGATEIDLLPGSKGGTLSDKRVPLSKSGPLSQQYVALTLFETRGEALLPESKGGTLGQKLYGQIEFPVFRLQNTPPALVVHLIDSVDQSVLLSFEANAQGRFSIEQLPAQRLFHLRILNLNQNLELQAHVELQANETKTIKINSRSTAESLIVEQLQIHPSKLQDAESTLQTALDAFGNYLEQHLDQDFDLLLRSSDYQNILLALNPAPPSIQSTPSPSVSKPEPTVAPSIMPSALPAESLPTASPTPTSAPSANPLPTPTANHLCLPSDQTLLPFNQETEYLQNPLPTSYADYRNFLLTGPTESCQYIQPEQSCQSLSESSIRCTQAGGGEVIFEQNSCPELHLDIHNLNITHPYQGILRAYLSGQATVNHGFSGSMVTPNHINLDLPQGTSFNGSLISSSGNFNFSSGSQFNGLLMFTGPYLPTLNLHGQINGYILYPLGQILPTHWQAELNPSQAGYELAQTHAPIFQSPLCPSSP